jgi:hypothetical protein
LAKTWVEQIVERLATEIQTRVREVAAEAGRQAAPGRKAARGGRKRRLDMRCRVPGCRNRSKGPRFGFICDDHRKKLSKKAQQAARDKWNAKRAA